MNPWIIVGFLVALMAVGAGGYAAGNSNGHRIEKAAWQERENTELVTANAKIHEIEEAARATERLHTLELANIGEGYEKEKARADYQKQYDVAAARAGALKLRIPAPACKAGGSDVPGTAPGAGQRDGQATTELPAEVGASLYAIADDADALVDQLNACQAVVESDRKALEK